MISIKRRRGRNNGVKMGENDDDDDNVLRVQKYTLFEYDLMDYMIIK